MGVREGQGLYSNVSQPRGTLVSVLLLLLLLLLSLVFSWLLFTQVNSLKGTCCILLTLFLSYCIRQTIPGITRRLHLGQVIELQVIELDRWGVWAQKSKMVRTALILQCRPFAPELEYSLALKWGSGSACRVNQWAHACTRDLYITESLGFSNHECRD